MSSSSKEIYQTLENTRYVFASTDVTAINSFIIAAIIGVLIALCGTWLAWWYGKKSFDLTQNSFDVTIKQILASKEEARENINKTFQMNEELIASQERMKHEELCYVFFQEWIKQLDDLSSKYFSVSFAFISLANKNHIYDELALNNIDKKFQNHIDTLNTLGKLTERISEIKFKLIMILNPNLDLERSIIGDLNSIHDWLKNDSFIDCFTQKKGIMPDSKEYLEFLSKAERCREKIIKLRTREIENKGLNNSMFQK